MQEGIKVSGVMTLTITGADGVVREKLVKKNMVMNIGLIHIAHRMSDLASDPMCCIEIGDGVGIALDPSNTANSNAISREACTVTWADKTVSYYYAWSPGTVVANITEAGIFNQPGLGGGGDMLVRNTFTAKPVGSGDSISIDWVVTYA